MTRRCMLLVAIAFAGRSLSADVYTIQVIDSTTGRGVPLVELTPQNGQTVITDSNGIVAFTQQALMNQNVSFGIRSYGYASENDLLLPTNGGSAQVTIDRSNLAERLY